MTQTNFYKKLVNVQQNSQNVPENGWNDYSKYKYPLFSDIIDTLKPNLQEQQLFLYFTVTEHTSERTTDGKKNIAKISMRATVVDGESGESLSTDCPGYSEDTSDKAAYQAVTNAKKYATLSLFGLRVGLDQETTGVQGAKEPGGAKKNGSAPANNKSKKPNNTVI